MTESIQPRSDQIERWIAVDGYEDAYEVSDLGRVRSLNRLTRHGHKRRGRVLRPIRHERGYLLVNLWRDNASRMHLVHRLVLSAFVGHAPTGAEARHLDGDAGNAALVNLSWGTHSDNEFDKVEHRTHRNASKTRCPAGHPYDKANTYVHPGKPHRSCRTCRRAHASRNYSMKKGRAA